MTDQTSVAPDLLRIIELAQALAALMPLPVPPEEPEDFFNWIADVLQTCLDELREAAK